MNEIKDLSTYKICDYTQKIEKYAKENEFFLYVHYNRFGEFYRMDGIINTKSCGWRHFAIFTPDYNGDTKYYADYYSMLGILSLPDPVIIPGIPADFESALSVFNDFRLYPFSTGKVEKKGRKIINKH